MLLVIDGVLLETHSDPGDGSGPSARSLRRGSVTIAEPTVVHTLANRSGADATSLHVYSPPLSEVTIGLHPPSRPPVDPGRSVVQGPALTVVRS